MVACEICSWSVIYFSGQAFLLSWLQQHSPAWRFGRHIQVTVHATRSAAMVSEPQHLDSSYLHCLVSGTGGIDEVTLPTCNVPKLQHASAGMCCHCSCWNPPVSSPYQKQGVQVKNSISMQNQQSVGAVKEVVRSNHHQAIGSLAHCHQQGTKHACTHLAPMPSTSAVQRPTTSCRQQLSMRLAPIQMGQPR